MRFYARLFLVAILATMLSTPAVTMIHAAQQSAGQPQTQVFDPYVARAREQLTLSEEQATALRQLLAGHAAKIAELRGRSQTQAYSLQLVSDIDREQRAIGKRWPSF
jgi:hypothetical protein